MILAKLSNKHEYYGIHPMLDKALDLLTEEFLESVPTQKTLIEGEDLFVTKFNLQTVPFEETFYESHKAYLDIHIILQGAERVDIAHPDGLNMTEQDGDFMGFSGEADQHVMLKPGTFMVVFPGDAHRLKIPVNQPGEAYTRVVFKVKVY